MVGVISRYGVGAGSGTGEAVGSGGGGGATLPAAEPPRLLGSVRWISTSQHREQFLWRLRTPSYRLKRFTIFSASKAADIATVAHTPIVSIFTFHIFF